MASAPRAVRARGEAERPPGRREYTSYDQHETITAILPAVATFSEVGTFSGRPDRIVFTIGGFPVEVRLRNRGEAPGSVTRMLNTAQTIELPGAEIVEARDPTGAGTQTVNAVGFYASRHIERRTSRRGPLLTDVRARDQGAPEQLNPR